MSIHPNPRLPARMDDDELALDRPARHPWRDIAPVDVPDRPEVVRSAAVQRAPSTAPVADALSRGMGLLLKLTVLLMLLVALGAMVALTSAAIRAPGAIGEQITSAIERGAGVVGAAGQRVADTLDPAHPPRQALAQDVEIDELL